MSKPIVEEDKIVSLVFTLKDGEGNVLEVATHEEPMLYLHGHSNLLPSLETALAGLSAGEQVRVELPPEQGFGVHDPERLQIVDREMFGGDDVEVGMPIMVEAGDDVMPFWVHEIRDDEVVLDGNHPFAGKNLDFDMTVIEIRDGSAEELEHGHAHGPHGHQH